MSKSSNVSTLRELIQIARDGAEFYEAAANEVADTALAAVFRRMGQHKRDLIAAFGGRLEMIGEDAPESGTVVGALRRAYAELRAALARDESKVWVAQLEETEDRLLAHVESAIADTDNAEIRSQLQAHLPSVRACHDEMRRWKMKLAA